ncbi:hypothetical protein HAY23_003164 [Salmonella enterica]|nr:hypothetical protein [Salmonella enterica]EAX4058947.1 hypothetical protein [Salmonella enterica]EDW9233209.1 hypothetical protein [Salmonella enterica]EEP0939538.1 hypothetical protein [Salmonella enterica]EEP0944842.1 hypothetical protein [Salmonella enterica]
MSKLTAKQIEVLSCVNKGEKPYSIWRQTLNALLRKGLITRTIVGYSITSNGIDAIKREVKLPTGYVVVLAKANIAMIRAGGQAARQYLEEHGGNSPQVIYQAMLAAAGTGKGD